MKAGCCSDLWCVFGGWHLGSADLKYESERERGRREREMEREGEGVGWAPHAEEKWGKPTEGKSRLHDSNVHRVKTPSCNVVLVRAGNHHFRHCTEIPP